MEVVGGSATQIWLAAARKDKVCGGMEGLQAVGLQGSVVREPHGRCRTPEVCGRGSATQMRPAVAGNGRACGGMEYVKRWFIPDCLSMQRYIFSANNATIPMNPNA